MNKLLSSLLLAATIATPALAGEGNGDPFPFNPPPVTAAEAPQQAPHGYAYTFNGFPMEPTNGQNSEVATANSLPTGALNGTVQYARDQARQQYFAAQWQRGSTALARNGR